MSVVTIKFPSCVISATSPDLSIFVTVNPEIPFKGIFLKPLPSPTKAPEKNEAETEPEILDNEPIISINYILL